MPQKASRAAISTHPGDEERTLTKIALQRVCGAEGPARAPTWRCSIAAGCHKQTRQAQMFSNAPAASWRTRSYYNDKVLQVIDISSAPRTQRSAQCFDTCAGDA